MKIIEIEIHCTTENQKHMLCKLDITSLVEKAIQDKLDAAILMSNNTANVKQMLKSTHDTMAAGLKGKGSK